MSTVPLDTSVIFDHLNGRLGRTEYLEALLEQGHVLACCPVNITEVYAGLRPGEESLTTAFLDSLEFFAVTASIAARAGLLPRLAAEGTHALLYGRNDRRRSAGK